MIIPDSNLLIYAYTPSTPNHLKAKRWWQATLSGMNRWGFPGW